MAIRIGPVIRTVGSGLLAHVSQVSSFDPCLLEARANRCECPIHMVVDRLGVGVPEGTGYLLGGHLIDDVQPDGEAVVGGKRFQSGGQDLLLLGEGCRIGGGFLVFRRGGRGECGGAPATARARRAVGGGELLQEVAEREVRPVAGAQQLKGFDVGLLLQEDVLEDALLQRRQRGGGRAEPPAPVDARKTIA